MPSRATATQLKQLQRRVNQLASSEKALIEARQCLIQKQQLLAALCDTFAAVQASAVGPGRGFNPCHSILQELSLAEDVLLSCLGVGGKSAVAPAASAADAQQMHRDLGVTAVAPRDDPLALFKLLLTLPPLPDSGTVTPSELGKIYCQTLLEASMQLHLVQSEAPSLQDQGRQRLGQLWQGQVRYNMSLILGGRPQVLEEMSLFNCETSAIEPDAVAKNAAQLAAVPSQLGLTEQQLQEISAGINIFKDLHNNILEQQQLLHAELVAQETSSPGVNSNSGGASSSHSSSLASTAPGEVDCLQHELEGRQRSTSRMRVLLHKEYLMRGAAGAWFIGCLDWQQLTKAAVLSWPYPLRLNLLALYIAQYAKEQQAPPGAAAEKGDATTAHQA